MTSQVSTKKPYHELFAEKVIDQLRNGTAPWQKPWDAGPPQMPNNPLSGTVYRGGNRVFLAMQGSDDPRWMTLRQANKEGYRIRKGAVGTPVEYWQWEKEVDLLDAEGNHFLDTKGNPVKQTVKLDRPLVRGTHVFNGKDIEGLEPWDPASYVKHEWDPVEKAENILSSSGAKILHDQSNRAYYSISHDEIHLPPRSNFPDEGKFYGTALHELGHWTGHESRMDREYGPFGSEAYAKEELRAEIASWMIAGELGISHEPGQHLSYVDSWVDVLKKDPFEIVRACRDAERIMEHVLSLDRGIEMEIIDTPEVVKGTPQLATEKTTLYVPFSEKDLAKNAGARWDIEQRTWYAPEGTDLSKFSQWIAEKKPEREAPADPRIEFAKAIAAAGLDLGGELPRMDTDKPQRVRLIDDKPGALNGAYRGFTDGIPAGWIENFSTGEKVKWVHTGHELTDEEKERSREEAEKRRKAQLLQREKEQNEIAVQCKAYLESRSPAHSDHPYLAKKGVTPDGLQVSEDGIHLVVPVINAKGELRSLQYINPEGGKTFQAGGEKYGNFCLFGADINKDHNNIEKEGLIIAEGVSTGKSLHMALGIPVAVSFDAGNLEKVAVNLRERFPAAAITICGDNDHKHRLKDGTLYNKGADLAQKAAKAIGGRAIIPSFNKEERDNNLSDFNDLHASRGLKEVKNQIAKVLQKAKEMER